MELRNKNAELVFIIDRSGSMAGMESDTIGGFNSMLEQQKKTEGVKFVTTYLFNQSHRLLHDRLDINEIRPLTEREHWLTWIPMKTLKQNAGNMSIPGAMQS